MAKSKTGKKKPKLPRVPGGVPKPTKAHIVKKTKFKSGDPSLGEGVEQRSCETDGGT